MNIDYDSFRKRFPNIPPIVFAMPLEGMAEFLDYMDIYTEREATYIKIIRILKRLKEIDLDNDYNDRINENLMKAFLNSMEREIEKRRILSKWLNPFQFNDIATAEKSVDLH